MYLRVCICMHVRMYVCMYVCTMYVCNVCMHVCMYVRNVCMHVCMFVCVYICVCMYVCMYVGMYVCMYVCVYECMYICVCMYVCIHSYVCACTYSTKCSRILQFQLQYRYFYHNKCVPFRITTKRRTNRGFSVTSIAFRCRFPYKMSLVRSIASRWKVAMATTHCVLCTVRAEAF